MCDTVCSVAPGAVFFGKNSDRIAREAQVVEVHEGRSGLSGVVKCTHLEVPQVGRTRAVLLSRPAWMWGCEMGANDAGVVAGNEAAFTRMPVEKVGLTGMDLMRLALERSSSAREWVDVMCGLLAAHPQGGPMVFRSTKFQYHSSYLVADKSEAWVFETAGQLWAAEKVKGVRTISNALTIGVPDLVHPGAADEARRRGWLERGETFDFAKCFADRFYLRVSGAPERRACTTRSLEGEVTVARLQSALREHNGRRVSAGLKLGAPCSHASWLPTRQSGQTTASMVSRLDASGARHWLTGTSSPCLSVFKPVSFELSTADLGPPASEVADGESLFWRHERLHREVLRGYDEKRAAFDSARQALEAKFMTVSTAAEMRDAWSAHREALPGWLALAKAAPSRSGGWVFDVWWRRLSKLDGLA